MFFLLPVHFNFGDFGNYGNYGNFKSQFALIRVNSRLKVFAFAFACNLFLFFLRSPPAFLVVGFCLQSCFCFSNRLPPCCFNSSGSSGSSVLKVFFRPSPWLRVSLVGFRFPPAFPRGWVLFSVL